MKNFTLLFLLTLLLLITSFSEASNWEFVENKGQWNGNVLFKTEIPNGAIFFENNRIKYHFYDREKLDIITTKNHHARENDFINIDYNLNYHAVFLNFEGAKTPEKVLGTFKKEHYYNYFIGKNQQNWATDVSAYEKIRYYDIYEDINLVFYTKNNYLKYDFELSPKADAEKIVMSYDGADNVEIVNGRLVIKTSVNEIKELKPYAYQVIDGEKREVICDFKINKKKKVSFDFPEGYDKNEKLIIDPTLVFSTYSGASSNNFGYTATFDSKGFLYTGSTSFGVGYPLTPGAYQTVWNGGDVDVAITKYSLDGSSMMYSTYLGGSGPEQPHSLIVNNSDELFIFGTTSSLDFAVLPNAYDTTFNGGSPVNLTNGLGINFTNGSDIFVSRLSANGNNLLASTYLGGSGNDGLNSLNGASNANVFNPLRFNYADEVRGEVIIDENNNIYIGTCTRSTDFPVTTNAFQPNFGGGNLDACLTKMDNNLTTVIWSSYFGGSGNDAIYSLDIDKNNDVLFTGGTTSPNLATTTGVLYPNLQGGRADGMIGHISKNGNQILTVSYFGSVDYDQSYFVQSDNDNNIYIYGQTSGAPLLFIENALYNTPGGGQFITKMSTAMDSVIWSTRFGVNVGTPNISPSAFLVDVCNKIYLSGWGGAVNGFGGTTGLDVTSNAFQSSTNGSDFYLMVMEDDASALTYGTYFGSPFSTEHVDGGTSRFDKKGRIYQAVCASCGGDSNFPTTPNAFSSTNNASCNNAVFKFDFSLPIAVADFELPPIDCAPYTANFNNLSLSVSNNPSYQWFFGDGSSSTLENPSYTYTSSGVFDVMLVITDTLSCNLTDTIIKKLSVLSNTTSNLPNIVVCAGDNEQIGLPPTGLSGITYQWSPSVGLSDASVSNPIVSINQSQSYQLVISNGICADTLLQQVNLFDGSLETTPDTTICFGDNLDIVASSDGFANNFIWSDNINFSNVLNSNTADSIFNITPSSTTTYYIKASNGVCEAINSVKVDVFGLDNIPPSNITACKNEVITLSFEPSSNQQNLTYTWQSNSNLSPVNDTAAFLSPNSAGNFNAIISNGTCADTVRFVVSLSNFEVEAQEPSTICKGTATNFSATSNAGNVSYVWSTNTNFSDTLNANNSANFSVNINQNQDFYVLGIDSDGCTDSDTLSLFVIDGEIIDNNSELTCVGDTVNLDFSSFINTNNLSFSWVPTSGVPNPNATQNNIAINQNTDLLFIISNGNCNDTIANNFEVINNSLTVLPTLQSCGNDTFAIGPNLSYDNTSPNFSWTPNTRLSANNIINPNAYPNNTITYQLIISGSGLTCRDTVRRTIEVTNIDLQTSPDTVVCKGQDLTLNSNAATSTNAIRWSSNVNFSNNLGTSADLNLNNVQNTQKYFIRYTSNGCVAIDSVMLDVVRDTSFTLPPLRFCIDDSVQAGISSSNNYIYTWIPSTGLSNPNIATPTAAPNVETDYVLIRDFQGICFDSIFQNIGPDDLITGNYNDTLLCFGDDWQVAPNIISGNFDLITWSSNSTFSDTLLSSNQIENLNITATDTNYYYVMIENENCSYKDSVLLNVSKIFADLEDIYNCVEDTFLIPSNANPSQSGLTYFWISDFDIIGNDEGSEIEIFAQQSGNIFLEIINNEGCLAEDSMQVIISPLNNAINISAQPTTIIAGQNSVITFDEYPGLNYEWTPNNITILDNGHISVSPTETTAYTLSIFDGDEICTLEKSIEITVDEVICDEPNIFVPNAFTPNGDGVNDVLFVNGRYLEAIEFSIYNRWGEKVFETTDQGTGWDGTYKGMNADPAVFVYHLKAWCIGGEEYYHQGNITLIR